MKKVYNIILRYLIIFILGLGNLVLFYKTLTPLTVRSVTFILNFFSPAMSAGKFIAFKHMIIEIIPSCVAGSAYYLMLILILSTPNLELKKTIKIILISFVSLFILNVLRIVFLTLINQTIYFQSLHLLFWYVLSTIFVIAIWLILVKKYKIKDIPVYSDLRYLWGLVKGG